VPGLERYPCSRLHTLAPSPRAFRLPRPAHEHATALAHAARQPRAGPSGGPLIPNKLQNCTSALKPMKNGSATAGICEGSFKSNTRRVVRFPFSGKK